LFGFLKSRAACPADRSVSCYYGTIIMRENPARLARWIVRFFAADPACCSENRRTAG
jgi:hypothetical protein